MEALGLRGCTLIYRRRLEDMPLAAVARGATQEQVEWTRAARRKLLLDFKDKYLFNFQERLAPVGVVVAGGRLAGLRFQRTEVRDGAVTLVSAEEVAICAPLVISSIGSIPEPLDGIPMRGELYPVKASETYELEGSSRWATP